MKYDVIVIGAGLTGLSTASFLLKKGFNVLVLEKNERIGGAIYTHNEKGFIFEEGPNTGVIGNPEVVELFDSLGIKPETADNNAEKRLILKSKTWHPLPSGAVSFFKTPLFSFSDKIKIMFEPLRKKGTDPEESVASLAARRIGQSFVDYAVNPFISGIYAGDPEKLITKYALPKLYNLEQQYGSFIGGAVKKSREPKSERERKVTRKVFSGSEGFGTLVQRLGENIGEENIICNSLDISVNKADNGYEISYIHDNNSFLLQADNVVSTVGAHALPGMFSFLRKNDTDIITDLNYAKIIQIAVAVKREVISDKYISFGGLIPQKENRKILGILFPSFCFGGRAPEGYATLAVYMGGVRHPEYIDLSDDEINTIVRNELKNLMQIPENAICFTRIFRHRHAIPQYEKSSKLRFETVARIEKENKGLYIAGNLRNGIGIGDRIKQAYDIAEEIFLIMRIKS